MVSFKLAYTSGIHKALEINVNFGLKFSHVCMKLHIKVHLVDCINNLISKVK